MSESEPSVFSPPVYTHRVALPCKACNGGGCAWCQERGTYEKGCGGPVEIDNHGLAFCQRCDSFVPREEIN